MKNLLTLTFALAIMLSTADVVAQQTQNVAATANVAVTINTSATAVDFGSVAAGQQAYLDPNINDGNGSTNTSGGSLGSFSIDTGTSQITYKITWTDGELRDGSNANPLSFTAHIFNGVNIITNGSDGFTINFSGSALSFPIGGTLQAPSVAGTYSTANGGSPVVVTIQVS